MVRQKIAEPQDAVRFAAQAVKQGIHKVVAIGGDGMLSLVINGILNTGRAPCAVGLIPSGTGNDFAEACGIPLDNPLAALDIAIGSPPVRIDVGQANETFFINVATGGFPAEAAARTSRKAKALLGKFAYFLTGLANIGNLSAKDVRFTAPGFDWGGRIYAFGVGNGRQAGGGFSVSPKAVANDGLLDLMIIPESEEGIIPLMSDYSRLSRLDGTDRIIYVQAPSMDLQSQETIHLNLDGEPIVGTEFRFKVHKRRLSFCMPQNSPLLTPPSASGEI